MPSDLVVGTYKDLQLASALLQKDRERARENVRKFARAPATLRAYAHDWKVFQAWCEARNVASLPAVDLDVCAFLSWLEGEGRKLSTIERAYSAIALFHRNVNAPGWQPPRGFPAEVKFELDALRHKLSVAQHGKDPVSVRDIAMMVSEIKGDGMLATRDRALCLLGYWGAFRRSEVCALQVSDTKIDREGVHVYLKRSKTDQIGEGFWKGLARQRFRLLCPAIALEKWLTLSGITSGPLFRVVGRWGEISDRQLGAQGYVLALKRYATAAGLDASGIAGHSFRSGLVTAAAKGKRAERDIMRQSGHKDRRSLDKYYRPATIFVDNVTVGLGDELLNDPAFDPSDEA